MKQTKISRRSFLLGLGAVSTAALLTACGEAASSAPASSAASSEAPASSASEVPAAPILTEDEFPVTDGSTACIPLIAQIMADTTGMELEAAQSAVTTNTTAWAWRNLGLYGDTENGTRLIIAYEAPESVKEELKTDGAPLDQKAIGRDALVFIVNEDNPVQSLTRQQLRDIYAGKITNWKDVGGEDADIVAFQRREDSGSQTLFQKLLIQGGELMDAPTELAPAMMGELVDDIAEYNNAANAIGFSVYYYISEMYSKPGLRLLAVDGVTPSADTIADESYPVQRVLCRSPAGFRPRHPGAQGLRLALHRCRPRLHPEVRLCGRPIIFTRVFHSFDFVSILCYNEEKSGSLGQICRKT